MRWICAFFVCSLLTWGQVPLLRPPVPSFPDAVGFGSGTPGGRGGKTLFVTSLADAGPGTLRAAIETEGPRIVLFRVNGVIKLGSPLLIQQPYITIAGQSAPGDGITLRGFGISIRTHDVILRFLRVRPGDQSGKEVDGIAIGDSSRNVIVDHCSVSWSVDEALSPSGDIRDITIQWNLIAESLNNSVHSKGPHGYGSLARATGGVTFYRNIWAHHSGRSPRLGDNYGRGEPARYDVFNNLIYNYGNYATGLVDGRIQVNYRSNLIIPGPDSKPVPPILISTNASAQTEFALSGNLVSGNSEATADNRKMLGRPGFDHLPVTIADFSFPIGGSQNIGFSQPQNLEALLLRYAGAVAPKRDSVDTRIVESIRKRGGKIIDSQKEVGGWPESSPEPAPADADNDGIPDAWERTKDLNPMDASDAQNISPSGYPWLEVWLNERASPGFSYWR